MKVVFALVLSAALMAGLACNDLGQLKQSGFNECVECDLSGANLTGANLDGVIGADFTGAKNVPERYLKD